MDLLELLELLALLANPKNINSSLSDNLKSRDASASKKLLGHPGKFIHYVAPLKTFLFLHSYYPKHPYHPGHQARLVWSPWSLRSLFVHTGRQGEGCRRQGPKYTRVFLTQTFI